MEKNDNEKLGKGNWISFRKKALLSKNFYSHFVSKYKTLNSSVPFS